MSWWVHLGEYAHHAGARVRGQTTVEWVGLAAVVVAIAAALGVRAPDVGTRAAERVACLIERASGRAGGCGEARAGGPDANRPVKPGTVLADGKPLPAGGRVPTGLQQAQPNGVSAAEPTPLTDASANATSGSVSVQSMDVDEGESELDLDLGEGLSSDDPASSPVAASRPYDPKIDGQGPCFEQAETRTPNATRHFGLAFVTFNTRVTEKGYCFGKDGQAFDCDRSYIDGVLVNSGWEGPTNHADGYKCGDDSIDPSLATEGKPGVLDCEAFADRSAVCLGDTPGLIVLCDTQGGYQCIRDTSCSTPGQPKAPAQAAATSALRNELRRRLFGASSGSTPMQAERQLAILCALLANSVWETVHQQFTVSGIVSGADPTQTQAISAALTGASQEDRDKDKRKGKNLVLYQPLPQGNRNRRPPPPIPIDLANPAGLPNIPAGTQPPVVNVAVDPSASAPHFEAVQLQVGPSTPIFTLHVPPATANDPVALQQAVGHAQVAAGLISSGAIPTPTNSDEQLALEIAASALYVPLPTILDFESGYRDRIRSTLDNFDHILLDGALAGQKVDDGDLSELGMKLAVLFSARPEILTAGIQDGHENAIAALAQPGNSTVEGLLTNLFVASMEDLLNSDPTMSKPPRAPTQATRLRMARVLSRQSLQEYIRFSSRRGIAELATSPRSRVRNAVYRAWEHAQEQIRIKYGL